MRSILMFVHIAASLTLIGIVLLQHGRGADAGAAFGSGASQTLFGARGSSSFLTRTTALLATIFFMTSLTLAYLSGQANQRRSVTELMAPAPSSPQSQKNDASDLPTSQIPLPESVKDSAKESTPGASIPIAPDNSVTEQFTLPVKESESVNSPIPDVSIPIIPVVPALEIPEIDVKPANVEPATSSIPDAE